jgi:hypothetical protein
VLDEAAVMEVPLANEITEEKKSNIRGRLNVFDETLFCVGGEGVFCDITGRHPGPGERQFADNDTTREVNISIVDALMLLDEPLF